MRLTKRKDLRALRRLLEELLTTSSSPRSGPRDKGQSQAARLSSFRSSDLDPKPQTQVQLLLSRNRKLEFQVHALKKTILDINSKELELIELKNRARINVLQTATDSEELEDPKDCLAEPRHATKKPTRKPADSTDAAKTDDIDRLFKSFRQENHKKKQQQNW